MPHDDSSDGLALHDYQIVARDFLRGRDRAALMMDMGLGKTAASLSALEPWHLPVLVVGPKRVAEEVWEVEKDLWRPDLTLAVAKGSPARRAEILASDCDILVVSQDNLRDVEKVDRDTPFRTLILDELSGYKNRSSVRWKTARSIIKRHGVPHVWGLTGTPAPNGYLNLWAQVALLDEGARLGKNITTYRSRYFSPGRQLPNGVIIEWNLREEAEAHIKAKIQDICLAMESEGRVKIPDVTVNFVPVELPAPARKAYRTLAEDLVVDLRDVFGGEIHSAGDAATLSTRLSQMTAGFVYEDPRFEDTGEFGEDGLPILTHVNPGCHTVLHTAKVDACREIIESPHTGGVLVLYRFIAERDMLLRGLEGLGVTCVDEPNSIRRWNAGEIPVLLAHPASVGHGLNLQRGGHTCVWTSLPWDLELWEQANKRLARQGQTDPVVIHVLLANKSIDHLVLRSLRDKEYTQHDLLAFLESPV